MALIQCSECGHDVSDKAAACPKCGNPVAASPLTETSVASSNAQAERAPRWPLIIVLLAALFSLGFLFAANRNSKQEAEVATAAAASESSLRPDDVVRMGGDAFGCEFESRFAEAVSHYTHNEMSAWARVVSNAPWCFSGTDLTKGQEWTVLQVRGNMIQIAQTTVRQYEQDPSRYKHAYWTAAYMATKVR